MDSTDLSYVSRRTVLAAASTSVFVSAAAQPVPAAGMPARMPAALPVMVPVRLEVNGRTHQLILDTRTTLLDALREHLQLNGSKKGCDHGQCGACTVLLDGQRINACLILAVTAAYSKVTTIEGLGQPGNLHPMQAAFIKHDGYQCGYCTPGQICSAVGVLAEIRDGVPSHVSADLTAPMVATDMEIRERMSGNICRCGAYSNIAEAMADVVEQRA